MSCNCRECVRRGCPCVERWIPVGEALPKPGTTALAVMRWGRVGVATHTGSGTWWASEGDLYPVTVTHWRPLPAPPEVP